MADAAAVPSHSSSDAPMEVPVQAPLRKGAWVLCRTNPIGPLEGAPGVFANLPPESGLQSEICFSVHFSKQGA